MRVAALDLGTNTFLLLVAEVEVGRIVRVIHDEARVVRLGQDVNRTHRFHPEALIRARECLRDYASVIRTHGAESVLACATSAARDVENREEFLQLGREFGIPIEVISGEREAELTFLGTIPDNLSSPIQIIDVGGGSTEFVLGDRNGIISRTSVDVGSVRLTEKWVTRHPIPALELKSMSDDVTKEFEKLDSIYESTKIDPSTVRVIAVAGTPTTLATIDQGLPFESERVHGYHLSIQRLDHWIRRLADMTIEERQNLAGMEPKRADVIVAGAIVLKEAAKKLGANVLEVSVRGLRYGIARSLGGE